MSDRSAASAPRPPPPVEPETAEAVSETAEAVRDESSAVRDAPLVTRGEPPVLPRVTRDESGEGWGERSATTDDDFYLRERPPHHEG